MAAEWNRPMNKRERERIEKCGRSGCHRLLLTV